MSGGRRTAVAVALLATLAVSGPAGAQAPDDRARVTRLDNGLTVVVRENPVAPVVAVALLLRMGSRWETPANAGISNFTHAVMVKGTSKHTGGELADAVALLGGTISAAGDVDYSGIQGTALARFWRELLDITAELALSPTLAPAEVDRERDWLRSRLQRRRDNAPARAFDEYYAALYGAHPYALSNLGTVEALGRIDHAAIVAWYRAFYRPERMTLTGAPYDDVVPFARSLIEKFPDRVIWGTDWPHPNMKKEAPDDGVLVDFIPRIAPSATAQQALLVDNPLRLYWR